MSIPRIPKQFGFLHRWNENGGWGLIYQPGGKRLFLHATKIISGIPLEGARAQFDVGPARSAAELEQALEVELTAPGNIPG